jgi:hypothetical protein
MATKVQTPTTDYSVIFKTADPQFKAPRGVKGGVLPLTAVGHGVIGVFMVPEGLELEFETAAKASSEVDRFQKLPAFNRA